MRRGCDCVVRDGCCNCWDTISNQATSPPTLPYLRVGVWATGILNQLNTIHFVTLWHNEKSVVTPPKLHIITVGNCGDRICEQYSYILLIAQYCHPLRQSTTIGMIWSQERKNKEKVFLSLAPQYWFCVLSPEYCNEAWCWCMVGGSYSSYLQWRFCEKIIRFTSKCLTC